MGVASAWLLERAWGVIWAWHQRGCMGVAWRGGGVAGRGGGVAWWGRPTFFLSSTLMALASLRKMALPHSRSRNDVSSTLAT